MTEMLCQHNQTYRKFDSVLDPSNYRPLPVDWIIGMTDVVGSTQAIQQGRYEDVNFLGASIIANVGNILGRFDFPFSFAGDGATFALPAQHTAVAMSALRQVAAFSKRHYDLDMRAGLLPLGFIRENGWDVRVARYAVSSDASYYMFSGGGVRWSERELKKGRFSIPCDNETPAEPDLTGLSCEWNPFRSERGTIASLLIEPGDTANDLTFSRIARHVMDVFDRADRSASPIPRFMPKNKNGPQNPDPNTWARVASNSDFRKFDDVLRLTLDCTFDELAQVKAILRDAAESGVVRYGLHCQSHAVMTCLVPSGTTNAHLHFLDGLDGGYAKAAAMLRLSL